MSKYLSYSTASIFLGLIVGLIVGVFVAEGSAFILKENKLLENISYIAATLMSLGLLVAYWQIKLSKDVAVLDFENQLFSEYRRIIEKLPLDALLGVDMRDRRLRKYANEFYLYIDLTNEQISLRHRGKICEETWWNWRDGIKVNLLLPAFKKSWLEIKSKTSGFQELRRLECEGFMSDPFEWR
jgi:hypothetical protein